MYKLIAIDMDGTLLRPDHTISQHTKDTIKKAQAKGVKVVLATGRPLDGVKKYLKELDMITNEDYLVCFNGALAQNIGTEEVLHHITLKGKDLIELHELAQKLGVNIHAFSKDGCITPELTKYAKHESELNDIEVNVIDYSTIDPEEDIVKIMMTEEGDKLQKAIDQFPEELYEKYTVLRSAPYFVEFLNKNANKGEGVRALAERMNVAQEHIMTFGDAGNDKHMIEYAGMGVAMGNAFEEIKEIANFITKTNSEDGVAFGIEKFVLNAGE
ncbi:MAG: HAD family hydrolase [Epulopiscium sp. Nele67-Bin005]|nr:MAG: HAD family hydrolase [Epulopiscium sp. Nele67-Bin005]